MVQCVLRFFLYLKNKRHAQTPIQAKTPVQAKTQLGDLEIQKSMIISNVQEIRSQFGELEQTLMKKYGENSVINLQTGEIKEKE